MELKELIVQQLVNLTDQTKSMNDRMNSFPERSVDASKIISVGFVSGRIDCFAAGHRIISGKELSENMERCTFHTPAVYLSLSLSLSLYLSIYLSFTLTHFFRLSMSSSDTLSLSVSLSVSFTIR